MSFPFCNPGSNEIKGREERSGLIWCLRFLAFDPFKVLLRNAAVHFPALINVFPWTYIISLQTACSNHKPAITSCNPCKTVSSSPAIFQNPRGVDSSVIRGYLRAQSRIVFPSGCFSAFTQSHYHLSGICQPGVGSQRMKIQAAGPAINFQAGLQR